MTEWIKPSDLPLGDQGFESRVEINALLRTIAVGARVKYPLFYKDNKYTFKS